VEILPVIVKAEKNRRAKVRGSEYWPSSNKFKVLTSNVM